MKALLSSCWRSSAATQWLVGSLAGSGSAGLRPRPSRAQTSRLGLGLRLSLALSGQPLSVRGSRFAVCLTAGGATAPLGHLRAGDGSQYPAPGREGGADAGIALLGAGDRGATDRVQKLCPPQAINKRCGCSACFSASPTVSTSAAGGPPAPQAISLENALFGARIS